MFRNYPLFRSLLFDLFFVCSGGPKLGYLKVRHQKSGIRYELSHKKNQLSVLCAMQNHKGERCPDTKSDVWIALGAGKCYLEMSGFKAQMSNSAIPIIVISVAILPLESILVSISLAVCDFELPRI